MKWRKLGSYLIQGGIDRPSLVSLHRAQNVNI